MDAGRYLDRIGIDRAVRADHESLRRLQRAHLFTVPFENLSIHLGEPIVLEQQALFAKIVERRRGGFCYEVNGLFGALLIAVGYEVTMLAARVHGKGGWGPPLDHLALRVDLGGEPWLVDVGFGRFSHAPLRLDDPRDQHDDGGVFRVDGAIIRHDGEPAYQLEPIPRDLSDFVPTCWWHQTSPASHFTQSTVCSMPTATGRATLSGRTLKVDGAETHLDGDDEVLAAYQSHFGITLDRVPIVKPR